MTATRDTTCDLIQRPGERAAIRSISMRHTPHGDAISDRVQEASAAVEALLAMGCLIDHLTLNTATIRVRLVRCPRTRALERHASHSWWYELNEPGEAMRGLCWRGVLIEWPIHSSDVPDVEAVTS